MRNGRRRSRHSKDQTLKFIFACFERKLLLVMKNGRGISTNRTIFITANNYENGVW